MNLPRQQFLAGAALTANERGAFPPSHGDGQFAQPPHGRMFSHHRSVHGFLLQLLPLRPWSTAPHINRIEIKTNFKP